MFPDIYIDESGYKRSKNTSYESKMVVLKLLYCNVLSKYGKNVWTLSKNYDFYMKHPVKNSHFIVLLC